MKKLDQLIFLCLVLLILILPVAIAGVEVYASLAAVLFLIKRVIALRRKEAFFAMIPDVIVVPALAFFSVCALSVCFGEAPWLGLPALIGKMMQGIFLLFAVIEVVTTRRRFLILLGAFALSAFVVSVDGLWQVNQGVDFLRGNALDSGRILACMKHPNDLGVYLIFPLLMSMGLSLWTWFDRNKKDSVMGSRVGMAAVLLFGLSLVALGLTYSRGAWLGAFVAALVFVLMRRKYVWACMGFVLVFALFFSPRMTATRNVSFVSDTAKESTGLLVDGFSGSDRLLMWGDASRIIKDHPVLGTGLNTYTRVIYRYSQYRKLYPHNGYLQITAELGFIGLGVFLWLLASVGGFAWKRIVVGHEGMFVVLLSGLFAAWIGFLVQSGLDTTLYSVQLSRLLWFVMGLLVAGSLVLVKESKSC
ncbi:MAG: O-antigen ligase family protein [Candidatus Omnitrophota bacterium]